MKDLSLGQTRMRLTTLDRRVRPPTPINSYVLSSTLIKFELVEILTRVDEGSSSFISHESLWEFLTGKIHCKIKAWFVYYSTVFPSLSQRLSRQISSIVMHLLVSFDRNMKGGKTPIQALACRLSSTLIFVWPGLYTTCMPSKKLFLWLAKNRDYRPARPRTFQNLFRALSSYFRTFIFTY